MLVTAWYYGSVLRYDEFTGEYLGAFVPSHAGGLQIPVGLAVGRDSHVYVADRDGNRILRYEHRTGAFLGVFASLPGPHAIVLGRDGNFYVTSGGAVAVVDGRTGVLIRTFGTGGYGLTFGPDGMLYVAGPSLGVRRFDGSTGTLIDVFCPASAFSPEYPYGVAFGPDGYLYAANVSTARVLQFDGITGEAMGEVAGGGLWNPHGLCFGRDGNLYVVSNNYGGGGTMGIIRFDGDVGAPFATGGLSSGGFAGIQNVAFTPNFVASPRCRNGVYINFPIESVVVGLSQPILTNLFNTTNILVSGPSYRSTASGITESNNMVYRFDFPILTDDGTYRYSLPPTLMSTDDQPIDLNLNGVPGETDDGYSFTIVLDTVPPRAVTNTPSGDVAGTITNVDVWFSELVDTNTISASNVAVIGPTNRAIPWNSLRTVGLNRLRFGFSPQTITGQYSVRVGPNLTDLAGNLLNQDGDRTFGETNDDFYAFTVNLVPVDLELTDIALSTNQLWAGDLVSVSWQGRNATGAPLLGNWVDGVYLSPDPFWNITDLRLGTVQHSGGLVENETYATNLTFNVPGLLPGNYHILVRADIGNQALETVETNNLVVSSPMPVMVRELAIGGSVAGTITSNDRRQYFAITVPAGESLRLALDGQSGVNHLFVNHASIPTRLNADVSGTTAGADQTVTLTGAPGGGTYYVLVSGEQLGGNGSFTLTVDTGAFFVDSIMPPRLVQRSGDRFYHTLNLTSPTSVKGTGFNRATTVEFVGSDGSAFTPLSTTFISPSTLWVSPDNQNWPADVYDVRVTKGPVTKVLTNAFTIGPEGEPKLEAHLILPGSMSPGFPARQTIWIEYANVGTAPMPAPLFRVTSYTNVVMSRQSLSVNVGGGSSRPPRPPRYIGVPLNSAQAMALGSGDTPGTLQPGERGRIPITYHGLLLDLQQNSVFFRLGSITADDTTIEVQPTNTTSLSGGTSTGFPRSGVRSDINIPGPVAGGFRIPFRVPWFGSPGFPFCLPPSPSLEDELRPESVAADAWRAVFSNLATNVGPLWADYVVAMSDNINHLARIGQATNDVGALFNFEMAHATGALNPVRTLAGSVDASSPSPGFPLVFRRVYGQPILSRYRLGPLGRGWSHNWDVRAELLAHADVLIRGPGGADRLFTAIPIRDGVITTPDQVAGYAPPPGDAGTLTRLGGVYRLTEKDQTIWQFGADGLLDYVQDPNGNRIACGYTGDRLTSLSHSSGKQLILEYDGSGRLWHLTDPLGSGSADDRVTSYEYQGEYLWRLTAPGGRVTTYAYQTGGTPQQRHALTNVVHPDLTEDSFVFDVQGRLHETSQSCCGAQKVTYDYDSAGTVTVTDATHRQTTLLYGLGGQLAQVRDGEGRVVNFTYDEASQLAQLLGPGGERYRYGYGGLGNLTGIEDPLRQNNQFSYEPAFNRLSQVRDARGNPLNYGYDGRGNLTSIVYADHTSEGFGHDTLGNVTTSTNRRGGVLHYAYNAAGQLTNKWYLADSGRVDFHYAYDTAGNLTNAVSPAGTIGMDYDTATDRLQRIEYPGGQWFEFEYDPAGRRTRRLDQDGHVTGYGYDPSGRLDRMTNELGQLIVDYHYDDAGRLLRKTLGNGVYTTNAYNNAGQLLQLANRRQDDSLLSAYEYTYDASGRRDSMRVTHGYPLPPGGEGKAEGLSTYGYDPLGQLTSVTDADGSVVEYVYDAAGNRTEVKTDGVSTPYSPNTLNQYTAVGGETLLYDADGNLTNRHDTLNPLVGTNYVYDIENRLVGVSTPTGTWTYEYDAFGNRVATTHDGDATRYVVDPTGLGNVVAEYDGGGNLVARYEHGFGLLARTDAAGDPAFYTFSAIGHTSELTDPSGAVVNAYAYDPFGISLLKTETIPNPFEFVGEFGVMNEGNGLEFMRARAFVPSVGRFLQKEPLQLTGGVNLYGYCRNNPISVIDPSGLLLEDTDKTALMIGAGGLAIGIGIATAPFWVPAAAVAGSTLLTQFLLWQPALWSTYYVLSEYNDIYHIDTAIEMVLEPQQDPPPAPGTPIPQPAPVANSTPLPTPDPDPIYQHDRQNSSIVRSRDPNDKLGPSGYGSAGYLPAGGVMAYQIRFENQPSATAPAQRVTVTDTLDPNLDLSTFELTEIAFANQVISVPAGLNHYQAQLAFAVTNQTLIPLGDVAALSVDPWPTNTIVVEVDATLDPATRQLTLSLSTTDPTTGWWPENPLIGFLYPNDTNHIGEGSLSYLVRANTGLATGTRIENRARIVFDYNDPIDTPLVFNTIDAGPPSGAVTALPASVLSTNITLSWSGQDDAGGSGVADYDVYVSEDDGPFILWMGHLATTSAEFPARPGHQYAFYSIARDNVGHEETAPTVPDASTFVVTPYTLSLSVSGLPSAILTGSEFSYAVVVTNAGPGAATNVVLTHTLDSVFNLVSAVPSQGTAETIPGLITARFGDLPPGSQAELAVTLTAASAGSFNETLIVTSQAGVWEWLSLALPVTEPGPTLDVQLGLDSLTFSWLASETSFVLETTSTLSTPIEWTPVVVEPVVIGDRQTIGLAPTNGTAFYRLRSVSSQ